MREPTNKQIRNALNHFDFNGDIKNFKWHGSGHINDTRIVDVEDASGRVSHYILQRLNTEIFTKPVELMENIIAVTEFIKKKVVARGGDVDREVVNILYSTDGKPYYIDDIGDFWRVMKFVEGTESFDSASDPKIFYASAFAFGSFQNDLSDFPASKLHETIPNFHNTESRYSDFLSSVEADSSGRKKDCLEEIHDLIDRKPLSEYFNKLLIDGKIPLRVTHNDTKLNNVMIDKKTLKGICIVDLDTVMPGISCFDFGDAIRFGANTASEDETDLSKVSLSEELFAAFTKGFIDGCEGKLTDVEIDSLYLGAMVMTYEVALRFLSDHLNGDVYFRIHHQNHNLERARCQIALLKDMEKKRDKMEQLVKNIKNNESF